MISNEDILCNSFKIYKRLSYNHNEAIFCNSFKTYIRLSYKYILSIEDITITQKGIYLIFISIS